MSRHAVQQERRSFGREIFSAASKALQGGRGQFFERNAVKAELADLLALVRLKDVGFSLLVSAWYLHRKAGDIQCSFSSGRRWFTISRSWTTTITKSYFSLLSPNPTVPPGNSLVCFSFLIVYNHLAIEPRFRYNFRVTKKRKRAWSLYILKCCDDTLYTGITNDLPRRVEQHNNGLASRYTRSRLPVKLVYQEPCRGRPSALKKEYAIKQLSRKEKKAYMREPWTLRR